MLLPITSSFYRNLTIVLLSACLGLFTSCHNLPQPIFNIFTNYPWQMWLPNGLAEPPQKWQCWSRRDFLKRLLNVDFCGSLCSTECEKQKQLTKSQNSTPFSISLEARTSNSTTASPSDFSTLCNSQQTRCTPKNFRP